MSDFSDVGDFHRKFGLDTERSVVGPDGNRIPAVPRIVSPELRDFRLRFLLEELQELAEGYGMRLSWTLKEDTVLSRGPQDLPKIADALVDLVYVAHGTAQLHGLPWRALWNDVQRANMSKERCGIDHKFQAGDPDDGYCLYPLDESACGKARVAHSLRGSAFDVIKPEGWIGPRTIEILMDAGWPGPRLPETDE